jgi:two-component system phosphate regulon response regulator PhoB
MSAQSPRDRDAREDDDEPSRELDTPLRRDRTTPTQHRVLVVEDDPDLSELLRYNLENAGYEARAVDTGDRALRENATFMPDLVLLDVMLEGISGFEVCGRLRAGGRGRKPIVIMVTARADEIDRVVGFEVGADDYVVKPFSVRELLLRVRAHLRGTIGEDATATSARPRRYEVGALKLDLDRHHVLVGDEEVRVSALEMRLLSYLVAADGTVCSRPALLRDVWNYKPGVTTRTVDTHVKRLRDKLGPAGALIETVRGLGYRLADVRTSRP